MQVYLALKKAYQFFALKVRRVGLLKKCNQLKTLIEAGFLRTLEWIYKSAALKLMELTVCLAGFFGFLAYDVYPDPEMFAPTAQYDAPFFAYFSLHNPSRWFSMHDVRLNCILESTAITDYFFIKNIPIDDGMVGEIAPQNTTSYSCPVKYGVAIEPPLNAEISIEITYSTLGFKRHIKTEQFHWDIFSKQWQKGKLFN